MQKRILPQRIIELPVRREIVVITQADLQRLESLQRIGWAATKQAGVFAERIRYQIEEQRAIVEDGPLYWDTDLQMARSRKTGTE